MKEESAAKPHGSAWAWLVLLGCIGFYSIPTGVIANTSGIFVAPVMDQFGWTQTDTTMYRTIQPLISAVLAPFAGKLLQKGNPRVILAIVSAVFGLSSWASAYATEVWQWNLYGVIFGITAAFFMYLAMPVIVNNWFKKSNGTAVAICAATLSLLAAVASPVGRSSSASTVGRRPARPFRSSLWSPRCSLPCCSCGRTRPKWDFCLGAPTPTGKTLSTW